MDEFGSEDTDVECEPPGAVFSIHFTCVLASKSLLSRGLPLSWLGSAIVD